MLETPHVFVGAAIATKIANPWLALPLAFASHFLFEKVPHWNPHLNTEKKYHGKISPTSTWIVVADASIALVSGTIIALRTLPNATSVIIVLAACFLSVLPDLVEAPYFFLNFKHPWMKPWIAFQKSLQADTTPFWGILNQLIVIGASLWWILG